MQLDAAVKYSTDVEEKHMNRHETNGQFKRAQRQARETAEDIFGKKPPGQKGRAEGIRRGIQRDYRSIQDGARNGS